MVPVEVTQLGKLNENFKLVDIESVPSEVEVVGPETELMNINRIVTYPVDLRTINEDTPLTFTLSATDVDSSSLSWSVVLSPAHGS